MAIFVHTLSRRDERGQVIPLVALALVALIIMTAIAVDGGNARQNRREAQAAADAGALAGAKALDSGVTLPANCTDVRCVAAYYTFQSAATIVGATMPTLLNCNTAPGTNQTCARYVLGSGINQMAVEVTAPYSFGGAVCTGVDPDPCKQYVHVKTTWNSPNAFGKVANITLFGVSGSATAQNTGQGTGLAGVNPPNPQDCTGEDNFTDNNDKPTIIPATSGGNKIGAVFWGGPTPDSNLDLNSIVFKAPDASGTTVQLGYDSTGKNGYTLTPKPPVANGNVLPYTGTTGYKVTIQYVIPANLPRKDASGKAIVYPASLHAADLDQDHGVNNPDCGNASWQFTWDGTKITLFGVCGENSFLQGNPAVFPNGTVTPSDASKSPPVVVYAGANYVDESLLQTHDVTDGVTDDGTPTGVNVGIDFKLSGPGFDDANGNPYQIPPKYDSVTHALKDPTGYTLTNSSPNYTTKIQWALPDKTDPRWVNGATYTLSLKAFDTDQNKPGNDCGQASWKIVIQGAAGSIHLIE